jgi:hypothetical protein
LGQQPLLPLAGDQGFRFFLFHAVRPVCEPETGPGGRAGLLRRPVSARRAPVPSSLGLKAVPPKRSILKAIAAPRRCSQPHSWLAAPRSQAAAAPIPHLTILTLTI